jgi:hypothetical protein
LWTIQVTTDIATLTDVLTCLQDSQDKIKFLQLESQLQQEEIQQKNHHSELVLVQNNSLFEFENDSYQQPTHDQRNSTEKLHIQMKMKFVINKFLLLFQANHQTLGRNHQQQAQNMYWI